MTDKNLTFSLKQNSEAMLVPRREKRLKFWKEWILQGDLDEETKTNFEGLLSTYSLLLSKRTLPSSSAEEIKDCENRLLSLENGLSAVFDAKRLITSETGLPTIES